MEKPKFPTPDEVEKIKAALLAEQAVQDEQKAQEVGSSEKSAEAIDNSTEEDLEQEKVIEQKEANKPVASERPEEPAKSKEEKKYKSIKEIKEEVKEKTEKEKLDFATPEEWKELSEKLEGKIEEAGKKAEADPDLADLSAKRTEFLKIEKEFHRAEKEYNKVKNLAESQGLKNMDRIKSEGVENYRRLKPIKDAYGGALDKYSASLLAKEKEWLDRQGDLKPEERMVHLKQYSFEVFKKITLDENEKLNQERAALLPKLERGIFGKALDKWQKMPNAQKWAIAAAAATGVAFAGGGAAIPAMTYFGYRLGRAALGTIAGRLAGGAYEKLIIKKGKEKTTQRIKKEAVKEISAADNLEKMMDAIKSQSAAAREKIAKQAKKEKWQRVGQAAVIAGTAGLASWGAGKMFDNVWGTVGGGAPGQPEKISGKTSVPPGETLEMPGGKASAIEAQAVEKTGVLSQETAAVPEFEDTVIVQKGDSVWKILEKQAGARGLFDSLEGSPEEIAAKKTYIIDALKRQASGILGLENPDLIQPGQRLNIGSLFENEDKLVETFNKAQNLTAEQIENINNYGKGAKAAAEKLTDAKDLTDNTVQTSEIKVAIPAENFTPTELTPDQSPKGPIQAPYIESEESWKEGLSSGKQESIKQVADYNLKLLNIENSYLERVGFDGLSDRSYNAVKNSSINDLLYQFRDIPDLADENKILEAYKNFPEKHILPGSGVFGTYTQLDFFKHAKLANWVRMNLEANPSFVNELKNRTISNFLRWTAK